MRLTFTLELPPDVEQKLRRSTPDLDADVREAYAVELFRRGVLSHAELAETLRLDRFETDALLKRHQVTEQSLTFDDVESDRRTLERLMNKGN
jgi:predicted HTH domain antitoxin